MIAFIKKNIRTRLGLDVRRYSPNVDEFLRLKIQLEHHHIRTVLDVGANTGQFVTNLVAAGWKGNVISFEPLPDAFDQLQVQAAQYPFRWAVYNVALSAEDGEATFQVSKNRVSSSLRDVTDNCVEVAPLAASFSTITVKTRRLDSLWAELGISGQVFLKVDAQGAEDLILDGAQGIIRTCVKGVQFEMAIKPMYAGQTLAPRIDLRLREAGFTCWDVIPGLRNPEFGLLEYDGVYFRE